MRERLESWVDPAAAFVALTQDSNWGVWLDVGHGAAGGWSYISVPDGQVLTASVSEGTVVEKNISTAPTPPTRRDVEVHPATIFEVLRDKVEAESGVEVDRDGYFEVNTDGPASRHGRFNLGWVGWLGYELAAQTTGVPTAHSITPDARFVFCDWALEFDHVHSTVNLLVLGERADFERRLELVRGTLANAAAPRPSDPPLVAPEQVIWRHANSDYEALVGDCLEAIRRGDAYQLCLTNQATVVGEYSPLEVYLRLRHDNPSHHGGLLLFDDVSLLSSSPEVFLDVDPTGHITTKPIKGTRPRGASTEQDRQLADELVSSDKERAENLMIVDLMRNDIGKVSQLGTVRVDSLLAVESYPNVHQLVSTVSGELAPHFTAVDAAEACFPAGSMTGAPKMSAMTLLHDMERGPRGIYSGAFGYFGLDGTADLAMVIRSIVITKDRATIGTGGGITVGSVPRQELEETWVKAAPLLRALGVQSGNGPSK